MALSTQVSISLSATLTGTAIDFSVQPSASFQKSYSLVWPSGTGAGQADVIWSDQRTIAPSGTDTLDFAGGSLVNAFGVALVVAKVKLIIVAMAAGNPSTIDLTRSANGVPFLKAAADAVPLPAGSVFMLGNPVAAGYGVTAGTADEIALTNGVGGPGTYDIFVIGTSA